MLQQFVALLNRHRYSAPFAFGILAVIAAMVMPIPAAVLDIGLVLSFTIALLLVFVAAYTPNPLHLSSFPALLILVTLFRLGLNVATTRLILGQAYAGEVVEAFGEWTVGGNLAVGVTIFAILVALNLMVISKGASRMSEVAARFQVDALAPKHMAIDGDVQKGLITEDQVAKKREDLDRTADFYAVMDGSTKAVRGDAILGIILVLINITVGLYVGLVQMGMPFGEVVQLYTRLTIGDGLVSVIPALLTALAAMIVVAQAPARENLGTGIFEQALRYEEPLWIVGFAMVAFGFVPGLPLVPFAVLGIIVVSLARLRNRRPELFDRPATDEEVAASEAARTERTDEDPLADILHEDAIVAELGTGLVSAFSDPGDSAERMKELRKIIALDLGVAVPVIRFQNVPSLGPNDYVFRVRGRQIGGGVLYAKCYLAIDYGDTRGEVPAVLETTDPSEGFPARWIEEQDAERAEMLGYTVVSPRAVLFTHLRHVLQEEAASVFGRQELQDMLDRIRKTHPAVLEKLVPDKIELSTLHDVLKSLLDEGIPIRDMVSILEAVTSYVDQARSMKLPINAEQIAVHVRGHLRHAVVQNFVDFDGTLRVIRMEEAFVRQVQAIMDGLRVRREGGGQLSPQDMVVVEGVPLALERLEELQREHRVGGRAVPVMVPEALRVTVRGLVRSRLPRVPVIADREIPENQQVEIVALWGMAKPYEPKPPPTDEGQG